MSSSTKKRRRGGRKTKSEISNYGNISSAPASASASLIGGNVDILTVILTRLPSKSLLVFKSVSKLWLSLITDPHFVHKHFIRNPRLSIPGVFWGYDSQSSKYPTYDYISLDGNPNSYVPFETLNFAEDEFGMQIVQSCNGLLLCKSCLVDFTYYIFNPFTNKYKKLPPPPPMRDCNQSLNNVTLAFDPFKSPYYKVLAFWRNNDTKSMKYGIMIYDSETSSWKLSGFDSDTARAELILHAPGIFWNGSLYWCSSQGSTVYFDIDRVFIGVVPLPSIALPQKTVGRLVSRGSTTFCIAEYEGHLYLIEKCYWVRRDYVRIFEMDAVDSCWYGGGKVFLRLNPWGSDRPYSCHIIFINREEENGAPEVVFLTKGKVVVSCDLKDVRTFKKIYDLPATLKLPLNVKFYQNIQSLAFV